MSRFDVTLALTMALWELDQLRFDRAGVLLAAIHRHIAAGGALPEQWCGPGTAVGQLLSDARASASICAGQALTREGEARTELAHCADVTRSAIAKVEGRHE